MANPELKTIDFKEKHKFALLKILMDTHKKYFSDSYNIKPCESVIKRSKEYLELSCNLIDWFKKNYKKTDDMKYVKITDFFDKFKNSEYFEGMVKLEKSKYTKKSVIEYISSNTFFSNYYSERYDNIRNVIKGWEEIQDDDI